MARKSLWPAHSLLVLLYGNLADVDAGGCFRIYIPKFAAHLRVHQHRLPSYFEALAQLGAVTDLKFEKRTITGKLVRPAIWRTESP